MPAHKKVGYFETEREIVDWLRLETGLQEGQRHPLTWIMEACDDVAYSILDVDDVMKKGIISPEDIKSQMENLKDERVQTSLEKIRKSFKRADELENTVSVSRDIKIGYMRAYLMESLLEEAANNYIKNSQKILTFEVDTSPLLENSNLCNFLKSVAKDHAFSNPDVLKSEAIGAQAIMDIMSFFWSSIRNREKNNDIESRRRSATSKFGWSLISSNYIKEAARCIKDDTPCQSVRYAEMRLLTDMVSGMTDSFAMKLWHDIQALPKC